MSAKNCEQYVRAILSRIGGPSFEQFLMRIVETDGSEGRAWSSDELRRILLCNPGQISRQVARGNLSFRIPLQLFGLGHDHKVRLEGAKQVDHGIRWRSL